VLATCGTSVAPGNACPVAGFSINSAVFVDGGVYSITNFPTRVTRTRHFRTLSGVPDCGVYLSGAYWVNAASYEVSGISRDASACAFDNALSHILQAIQHLSKGYRCLPVRARTGYSHELIAYMWRQKRHVPGTGTWNGFLVCI